MAPYPNLISDSLLISETIELLQSVGGRATAVNVVDYVMKIRKPAPDLAKTLVSDLIEIDPRLQLNEDFVELIETDFASRKLAESDFVVFDLETTGAKCPPCRVTEIGAYRVKNGAIVDEFQTLINPEMPIPSFISQLTGISNEMVKNAPKFREIVLDFLDFIGDSVLVAHNASFDMRFLNHEIGIVYDKYRLANPHLCTVQLSRKLLPDIENHRLNTVAEHFRIALINHHRAAEDARATAHIFINLLEDLHNRGVHDYASAKKLQALKAKA
ncbi:MAG TPA: exonuclease domain-containing protein [Pyrinomonadaceae bacterium]|nr:exonuclease domain-containing protein [Pyrinomonadaceae bacterium]